MPSGSGHSGGGHFGGSGGSFSGGSSHHSGGSGGYKPFFTRGIRGGRSVMIFNFGSRSLYAGRRAGSAISVFFILSIIMFFLAIISGVIYANETSRINKIISDNEKYSLISSYAIEHPNYQLEGVYDGYEQYGTKR